MKGNILHVDDEKFAQAVKGKIDLNNALSIFLTVFKGYGSKGLI